MASKGQKRGFGECEKCGKEILLASSYNQGVQLVWSSPEGSMSSIKMTPNDDRNFAFVSKTEAICHTNKCPQLRCTLVVLFSDNKLYNFI